MKRILITGINGFIGAAYADIARSQGLRVIGTDIGERDAFSKADEYFALDLSSATSDDISHGCATADYVLHAGGISGFMVMSDRPDLIGRINIGGTAAILGWAREAGCRRAVLCSTIMVYGPSSKAVRLEDEYPDPISVYGASKVAVEGLMLGYAGQYGIDAVALRFSHVYGPGRTTECFIREMLLAAAVGRPCKVPQASSSVRQYVHIDDVCRSIALAFALEAPRERVFNISGGEIHSLAEVAAAVRAATERLEVGFDESRDIPAYRIGQLSLERAREVLGYEPAIPLATGIARYRDALASTP